MSNRIEKEANRALVLVSMAVLLASSTWFSGTAAAPALISEWKLSEVEAAWLTIAVQLGFICGTLLYALFNLADLFNARRVFLVSALLGAGFNIGFALVGESLVQAVALRLLTGMTLAGIYPVGMKLIACWFQSGLGWRLGILVGALTLGTASPYLIQALGSGFGWRTLAATASASAAVGGVLVIALRDGPFLSNRAQFDVSMSVRVFSHGPFRDNAIGYFGHMWELYAFWSMLGFFLGARPDQGSLWVKAIPLLVFLTIGMGAVGCVVGGWISKRTSERQVALLSLAVSCLFCLCSGLLYVVPAAVTVAAILVWGFFVVSDSPQFSALAARHCPPEYTGTALTVQNGVGFAVTIASIQLTPWIAEVIGWQWALTYLGAGPLLGFCFMRRVPSS